MDVNRKICSPERSGDQHEQHGFQIEQEIMPVKYRTHTKDDFEHIAGLRWSLKTEDQNGIDQYDEALFRTEYLNHLQVQEALGLTTHWVIEAESSVHGVMTVRKVAKETSVSGRTGNWGYLTNAYVCPAYRNSGHGTALIHRVIDWARSEELEFMLVWPSDRSRAFYLRAGFHGTDDPLLLEL